MLRTKAVEERLRRGRIEAKTRDAMFRAKIEVGAAGKVSGVKA